VNRELLGKMLPNAPAKRLDLNFVPLTAAMEEFDITTPIRQAAFLAQIFFESAEFRLMEEGNDGSQYEGRVDLGNTTPGDGARYKGRGPIQLTGRANYRRAGGALQLELEKYPQVAALPSVGFRVAGWYWKSHGLNELADACTLSSTAFDAITRRINGALYGKDKRDAYFARNKEVLLPETCHA
jgi:putative chitinase